MKKSTALFVLYVLLQCTLCIMAQTKSAVSDTTLSTVWVEEDTHVSKVVKPKMKHEKKIPKDIYFVSGVASQTINKDTLKYFEIIVDTTAYYIEKDKIKISLLDEEININDMYSGIEAFTTEQAETFRELTKRACRLIFYGAKLNEDKKKYWDNCKKKGIAVLDWSYYDESEYSEGTSVKITVYNPTEKTIKYLWFTFNGYNSVGDLVVDRVRKTGNITTKGVGPIEKGETGTYEFTYVWFTDLVQKGKLKQIKVQYMDGSMKVIKNVYEIAKKNYGLPADED